jgi:hypothetical protein
VSKQTNHRVEKLWIVEGPPGKLKGSAMVRCEALWKLEIWQRVDFLTDRENFGRGLYRVACPIPTCGQTIELNRSEIEQQMVE